MKPIFVKLGIIALLASLFVACGPTAAEKEEARVRRSKTPNQITWDTIVSQKKQTLDSKKVQASSVIDVSYIAPKEYVKQEVLDAMLGELNYATMGEDDIYTKLTAKDAVNKYVMDYVANYKKEAQSQIPLLNKVNGENEYFTYNKKISTEVKYNEANFVSYQINMVENKGSNTSTISVRNIVIDLTDGKALHEKDIFKKGTKEELNKIIIKQIIKDNQVSNIEELQELGYWGVADLSANNNFYVDKDGITYTFNPEEYADAKLGVLKVFINYDDMMDIFKDDAPIALLIHDLDEAQ